MKISAKSKSFRKIQAGVCLNEKNQFVLNFDKDNIDDIIYLTEPLKCSEFRGNVYWFGYKFNESIDSKMRTRFIHYIKGIGEEKIPDLDLMRLIYKPMHALQSLTNRYDLECLVYPGSNRSDLVKKMLRAIRDMTSHDMDGASFELVKQVPTDIEFNWKAFEDIYKGNPNYLVMVEHIKNKVLPAIQRLDYFSIVAAVKSKCRPFIEGFLKFSDEEVESFSRLNANKILVIDDINTSGSTLNEIIRTLIKINPMADIFIYTLVGNFKS